MQNLYTSDYERHKNRNPERAPGTCEWVFGHSEYLKWVSKSTSSLLWVSADPGCGKSVLASFLVDEFKRSETEKTLPSTVCFFFFKDDSDEQNNALSAVSSILYQLLFARPKLIKYALEQYNIKGKWLFRELRSLWNIFMSAATDSSLKKVTCVIDGVDECQNPSRDEFFQLLSEFYAKSTRQGEERTQLKIILLSRPYSFIEDALHHPLTIRMKMEDESDLTGKDVELVIRTRVAKFGSKRNISDQVQTRLIDRLISCAGQTFLWVSLVLADLASSLRASEMKLLELISQIPPNLNAMYEKILGKSQCPKDARKVLYIIVGAVRPLSLAEMNIAFVIKPKDRDYDHLDLEPAIERTIRNLCGLFVKVVDSKIYLVHQTAREFLIRFNNPPIENLYVWQNSLDPLEADNILAQICISYLMLQVFEEQAISIDERGYIIMMPGYLEKHKFLDYAAVNWVLHFRNAQKRVTGLVESVLHLLNTQSNRFQTWLELFTKSDLSFRFSGYSMQKIAPLHIASFCGFETIINILLEKGADINALDSDEYTSLMQAILHKHDAVINLLLEKGAHVEINSRNQQTALHIAVQCSNESVVRLLLEKGANIGARNSFGQTALHLAARDGQKSVIMVLLEMKAEVNLLNIYDDTALHFAALNGNEFIVKLLLENDGLPDIQNFVGQTAMHLAAEKGYDFIVKLFLENGALPNAQNNKGETAMHYAARNQHDSIVKLLLENGALPDIQNDRGETAMHLTVWRGNESIVKLLLENEARHDILDRYGHTPLDLATMRNQSSVINFLREHGARPRKIQRNQ